MIGQTVDIKGDKKVELALHCASEILGGGMTGRLMHTVRKQKGLVIKKQEKIINNTI
jgi:predicted Zn-dependent peptidase